MAFPTTLTNAQDGVTDVLDDHINALEAKVGIDSSAVTTSHDYKLGEVTSTDKAVGKAATQTLTNKTLTSPTLTTPTLTTPVINGAVTGTMTPPLTFYASNFNAPEGFLINGKIVPSVASNNLTVAIKGMDGNDPSASNPVYIRIGSTIRAITAALSVTKNAGTNWCNAGGSELATKEIDYFVYIGYNATDGVVVGFSRIPYASSYDDFSTTATNEKYCAISTITNAAATDYYLVVGRFAATLSAGAGYTWTVPTFTAKNLKQYPIYETRTLDWIPALTGITLSNATTSFKYSVVGSRLYYTIWYQWGSSTSMSANLGYNTPFSMAEDGALYRFQSMTSAGYAFDVSAYTASRNVYGVGNYSSTGTFNVAIAGSFTGISSTSPFTWASGDRFYLEGYIPLA